MSAPQSSPLVLLVDDDPARRRERSFALESRHGYRVIACGSVREARNALNEAGHPAAVITRATLTDDDAIALLQRIPAVAEHAPATIVLAESAEHGLRRLAWAQEATCVLTEPVDESELAAAIRAVLLVRTRRLEATEAQHLLTRSMDHLTDMLVLVLDAALPGSADRGAELVRLASEIGSHFAMDARHSDDLLRAARLRELGYIVLGAQSHNGLEGDTPARIALASARLLVQIPALSGVAELLEHVGANWDGSGLPNGVQRGQIPLRSRILRVAIDAQALVGSGACASSVEAVELLRQESGHWYDPSVVAALAEVSVDHTATKADNTLRVGYDKLAVGMRLAGDLHTTSGVKLLAVGTVLTAATLQLLRRRHELDPLVLPVLVRQ